MKGWKLLGFACAVALISAAAQAQAIPGQCGYDRWPVKILADKDHGKVDFSPIDATVAELGAVPIHEVPYPYDQRIAPEELKVYRITATLLRVRREKDSDLHLLVADLSDPSKRMIAEIPAPECAIGTGHEEQYRAARVVVAGIPIGSRVELIGVGFFDFLHEQHGAAKNGMELHPVLRVRKLSGESR